GRSRAVLQERLAAGEGYSGLQVRTLRLQRIPRTSRVPDPVGPDGGAAFGQLGQLRSDQRSEPSRQTVPHPTTTPATTPIESPVTTKTAKGSSSLIDFSAGARSRPWRETATSVPPPLPTSSEASRAGRPKVGGLHAARWGFSPFPTLRSPGVGWGFSRTLSSARERT